jgi:hypothetical protein
LKTADAGRDDAAGVGERADETTMAPGLVGGDEGVEGKRVETAKFLGSTDARSVKVADALGLWRVGFIE